MMENKHSELPWSARLHYHIDEPTELYIVEAQENVVVSFFNDNKENCYNANFIVKAVNNHQKLVDMVGELLAHQEDVEIWSDIEGINALNATIDKAQQLLLSLSEGNEAVVQNHSDSDTLKEIKDEHNC